MVGWAFFGGSGGAGASVASNEQIPAVVDRAHLGFDFLPAGWEGYSGPRQRERGCDAEGSQTALSFPYDHFVPLV
jgi:hypothetical protein